jgi:hypothetical protein
MATAGSIPHGGAIVSETGAVMSRVLSAQTALLRVAAEE